MSSVDDIVRRRRRGAVRMVFFALGITVLVGPQPIVSAVTGPRGLLVSGIMAVLFVFALVLAYLGEKRSQARLRDNVIPGTVGPLSSMVLLVVAVGFLRSAFPDERDLIAATLFAVLAGLVIGYARMVFDGISSGGAWK